MSLDELYSKLWKVANKLRGSMDPGEYKNIILGLIFLKYVSDKFNVIYNNLEKKYSDPKSSDYESNQEERKALLEDRDVYISEGVLFLPKEARYEYFIDNMANPQLAKIIDDAMDIIEKNEPRFKGILPKVYVEYSRQLDYKKLGEIVRIFGEIGFHGGEADSIDVLGKIYEYFIGKFAEIGGGEFYTPSCIVQILVEILEPYEGRVFDPACGSGGMFIQSAKFLEKQNKSIDKISIYGQEANYTTWKLVRMNLEIRGINSQNIKYGDSYLDDKHQGLKADFVIANPPFNDSDWGANHLGDNDVRLKYGLPPANSANFMWIQHFLHHTAENGKAGFVMANRAMSSNTNAEYAIRKGMIEDDKIDVMISLPPKLFMNFKGPVTLWFLTNNKTNPKYRNRKGETLFIDARNEFEKVSSALNEIKQHQIEKIVNTVRAYRGEEGYEQYEDIAGFCKVVKIEDIAKSDYVLTPGRYVGTEAVEDDGIPFEEKMAGFSADLREMFARNKELEAKLKENFKELGFEI
ncbi:MAG: class I SAM-dependent DNA methyltransferase [Candidatus Absconditabacteria bacterium]